MKKQALYIFFASLVLVLSGCGSNDKVDGGASGGSGKVISMQPAPLTPTAGKRFEIDIPIVKTVSSKYKISLKYFKLLNVEGCEIERVSVPLSLEMTGDVGSTADLKISGNFKNDCTPGKYRVAFEQTVSDGTLSKTETVTYDSSTVASGGAAAEDSEYYFSNVKVPEISVASKKYVLEVQLAKGSSIAVGKTVKVRVFSNTYGDLTSYEAQTGTDGYAVFSYTSPDALPGNGMRYTLTAEFMDESNKTVSQPIILMFNTDGSTTGDLNTTLPVAIVPTTQRTVTLTNNGQSVDIAVKVYKDTAPYAQGDVKVELPSEVLNGVDVGLFSAYTVPVNSQGVALFHYTGPSNLQALIDDSHLGSVFKFYHSENTAPESRQPMNVRYQPGNNYVPIDYRMIISTQNDDFSMGIPELIKVFTVLLQKKDGSDLQTGDANITRITVQTENASVAQLYDASTSSLVDRLTLQNIPSSPFYIKSKKLSGIVPIRVKVEFNDANGDPKSLETIVNIRVMSGPPSAISISYVSTGQDKERAKYIERFAISATDEYGNNVNTKPYVSLGAIAGYTVDGREAAGAETNGTKRLFYGRDDIEASRANGSLDNQSDSDPHTTHFEALIRPDVFKYVNAEGNNTDKLVIFGAGKNYEAMGKWDFSKISDTLLDLEDDYYGQSRTGLYYAIGRNYYQDQCRQDGREWTGNAASDTYQLDDEGTVLIEYKYDYHLSGKDVMVWVNLDGIQPDTGKKTRIGEVTKHTLRTAGLISAPSVGYKLAKGTSGYGTFTIWHENAPERYRNAHFGYDVKAGSTCAYHLVAASNSFDARTCDNGNSSDGTSYVTFLLSAPPDKDCTFDITNILPSSEF